MLSNWVREYKNNEYNVVIKKKGRPSSHKPEEITQRTREEDPAARRRKLKIAYRQSCQSLRKKLSALDQKPPKK